MYKKLLTVFSQGHERSNRAIKNIIAMFFIKGVSVLLSLLLVPLTLSYVSSEQYGIWLTLSSIITWASLFDIGLGNGLRNKFSQALAEGKHDQARIFVSTTYFVLSFIMLILFFLFLILNLFLDWSIILNTPHEMSRELKLLAIIVFFSFISQFVLQLVITLLTSFQKPAIASLFSMLSQILILIVVFTLKETTKASLIYLGLTMGGAQIFILICFSIWFFQKDLKLYVPSFHLIKLSYIKDLLGIGFKFFIIQIAVIIVFQTNNIIIIHILGPEHVTIYNIAFKYLSIITMLVTIVITPFWSAFTEAYVKNELRWMSNVIGKMNKFWFLTIVITILLIILSPITYKLWLNNSIKIPYMVTVAMGGYVIVNAWTMIYSYALNGIGKIKMQFYAAIILCFVNIPLTFISAKMWGLVGLIFAQTISIVLISSWWMPIQIKKLILHRAKGIWNT